MSVSLVRATVIFNPATAPHAIFLPIMEAAATQLGVALAQARVTDRAAIEPVLDRLASEPGSGLILMPDVFTTLHGELIFALATRGKLPTVCPLRVYAALGGLLSYGSNSVDTFRQAATYVDRILRGDKPRDLPVQDPVRYELVINLKTAKAIGLTVPVTLLATADEIIE